MANIDFSAITSSPGYEQELKSLRMEGKKKSAVVIVGLVLLFIFPLTMPFMIVWAITKIPASIRRQKQNNAALAAFAQANGFSYQPFKNVYWGSEPEPELKASLPYQNVKLVRNEGCSGTIDGWQFDYYNCFIQYLPPSPGGMPMQKSANNYRAGVPIIVFRLTLPIDMPSLLANSKFNDMPGFQLRPDNFIKQEQYRLEGDFPKYYTVHAERTDRISAIAVLSPEVMQSLKEHNYFDVWMRGRELVLITSGVHFLPTIPDAFQTIQVLMKEVDLIARSLNAQRRSS